MYNKIYQILDEKGMAKTGIFLDGPYMGKKCILKPETVIREENCGEAAEKQAFHRDCSAVRVLLQQCGLIQEIRLVHSDSTI